MADEGRRLKRRLCIVAPFAWPLFDPSCGGAFGGSEVRVSLLARELAKRGRIDVQMVVYDFGQDPVQVRDGITFHTRPEERAPVLPRPEPRRFTRAWLRAMQPQSARDRLQVGAVRGAHGLLRMGRALRRSFLREKGVAGWIDEYAIHEDRLALYDRIGADLWMVAPGGLFESAEVAFHCRRRGLSSVYLASSDIDLVPDHTGTASSGSPGPVRAYAIRNAAGHVVQTEEQAGTLERHWQRKSYRMPNPVDTARKFALKSDSYVLWVGKSSHAKNPERVFELARRMPDRQFVVVLNVVEAELHRKCVEAARRLPNVKLHEYVPFAEIERLFAAAAVLVNTSRVEGFPNAFLQAAKYGLGIVSLSVDPGGMLSEHGCGFVCAGDAERMIEHVTALIARADLRKEISEQCLAYVSEFHGLERVVGGLEEYLLSV